MTAQFETVHFADLRPDDLIVDRIEHGYFIRRGGPWIETAKVLQILQDFGKTDPVLAAHLRDQLGLDRQE